MRTQRALDGESTALITCCSLTTLDRLGVRESKNSTMKLQGSPRIMLKSNKEGVENGAVLPDMLTYGWFKRSTQHNP